VEKSREFGGISLWEFGRKRWLPKAPKPGGLALFGLIPRS
jgi:hypothetical protein